ncbi:hypothetical protein NBRC10512_000370 [Rhodotorula toruloides]|uniref:RHTO0S26e00936g1_1 n=1 Tax=Rhodotorula toruloides TaxID=5286 RepID=A0A061BQR1_RHOTO|nr:RHTO0S26e00936g1_1 [Rhodotorula toruloides]
MAHLSATQRSASPVSPLSRPHDWPTSNSSPHRSSSSSLAQTRTPASESNEQRRRQIEDVCGHVRLVRDGEKPAFELLVLGCGGGPIETNLSSFLVKPYGRKWTDGCTGLEGGSTIGALAHLVERNPYAFEGFGLGIGVDADELEEAAQGRAGKKKQVGVGREGGGKAAGRIWDMIRCFAITHAHLDHIAGLIISSAACRPPPKPVYGIQRTIANIERVMDGGPWPVLGGWDEGVTIGRAYHYKHIPMPSPPSLPLSDSLSFTAYPLSHGTDPSFFHKNKKKGHSASNGDGNACLVECYDSTAFFVREEESGKEMLFFGDVEPDSISQRSLNRNIWKVAAPKIARGDLSIIFLECSYPSSQPKDKLFGHFSPPYILEEMEVLAELVIEARKANGESGEEAERDPLRDVIVVIQHIKDDIFTFSSPMSDAPPPVPPKAVPSRTNSPLPPLPDSAQQTLHPPLATTRPTSRSLPSTSNSRSPSRPFTMHDSPLLSMSPPAPSVPIRRPSSAAFAFSSTFPASSMSFTTLPTGPGSRLSMSLDVSPTGSAGSGPGAGRRVSTPAAFSHAHESGRSAWTGRANPFSLSPVGSPARSPARADLLSPTTTTTSGSSPAGGALAPPLELVSDLRERGRPARLDADELAKRVSTAPILEEEDQESSSSSSEEMVEETVHERIERELNELEEMAGTGVRFLIARQGMRLVF